MRRREPDSVIDAVVPEVLLLPPRRWVTAAGVAGALCLACRLPHCSRGMELDSKLADAVLEVLPPSLCWVTAVPAAGVAGALYLA